MQTRYNPQLDISLPPLGFGVMRLPQNADGSFPPQTHSLLATALEKGINYFDTAYTYLRGRSEELLRDAIVKKYPRDNFFIADKLPPWECHNRQDMDRIFDTQLERLGVDYIDFYLLHALNHQRWLDLYNMGVLDFLNERLQQGQIRKVGFSIHDTLEALKIIESAYDWNFALLQINYYDWVAQRAEESYEYIAEHQIPCMVMEPVGGGRLSKLPPQAIEALNAVHPNESATSWALRFVAALPNVVLTLSGMNTVEQIEENIKTFSNTSPLSKAELNAIDRAVEVIRSTNPIPCTTCRYCVEDCPQGVDIPNIIQRFNDCRQFHISDRFDVQYFVFVPDGKKADSCTSCGICTELCPQNIDIPQALKMIHNTAIGLSIGIDIEKLQTKEIITLFGCGEDGRRALAVLRDVGITVRYFCDNNAQLWGSAVGGVEVINPQKLLELNNATVLITSSKYCDTIKAQLSEMGIVALNT